MKRRLIYGLVISAVALNLLFGAWIYLSSAHAAEKNDSLDPNVEMIADALERVRTEYVDGQKLTYQDLTYAAVRGMVQQLDPHSEFMDPSEYHDLKDDTEGQFGGLGLIVTVRSNYVTVVTPMEDSPGFRAGILAGDRVIKIDGESAVKLPLEDAVKKLRGAPDSRVTITISRPSSGMIKDFTLTRAIIQMKMVEDINGQSEFPLGDDKIGYVCITQFGDRTGDEVESALKKLRAQGMKALILDLRWNPGGLLDEAVNVCQQLLPRGQLIVSTEGRAAVERYFARGTGDELHGMPIVVLVNLSSASASEIVTGCLQDLHRAIILGEKTFGKGSVQSIFEFDDGSALKLTTAKYYTPSHRVIHEHGITPDILVPLSDEQEALLQFKRAPGGSASLDEANQTLLSVTQDPQLDRAQNLLEAILLYKGLGNGPTPGKMAAK
jgi:carboxyl-terminal processing protease